MFPHAGRLRSSFTIMMGIFQCYSEKVAIAPSTSIKPGADVAFKALLSARFCAAVWSHIADCDETFNYWEPLHYLIYGYGLQTWEYSPQFALRSYTYLLFHGTPAWFYNAIFHPSPMLIFYFVRCLLGFFCALVEAYFYKWDTSLGPFRKSFQPYHGSLTLWKPDSAHFNKR